MPRTAWFSDASQQSGRSLKKRTGLPGYRNFPGFGLPLKKRFQRFIGITIGPGLTQVCEAAPSEGLQTSPLLAGPLETT